MSEHTVPSNEVVLDIQHMVKTFDLGGGKTLTAVNDISLQLYKGESLAIVGESGSGKSTLVKCLVRLHRPTSGAAIYGGTDLMKLGGEELRQSRRHIQMVFQDPNTAFNPKMRIKDIICEPLYNFDLIKASEAEAKAKEMLRLVEMPEDIVDRYPANMSGGQRQRIGIARALVLNPDILVCDEATSALDVSVQKKIVDLLLSIQKKTQLSIIFICHDLALVYQMCHRAAVMYRGNVVEVLPAGKLREAKHPYTQKLLSSIFPLRGKKRMAPASTGEAEIPAEMPAS
ncbi:MAG: ABC transporter ATP-binding protein [Schwartzia sp. (in: firmicutes)]